MPLDIKYALRQLAKAPGFTAVVLLSLALGIGATTTVFSWIQGILLNPLPGVARADEMVVLTTVHDKQMWDTVSPPDIRDYREQVPAFTGIIGSQITPACLTVDGRSSWFFGQVTTANFFDVLGVKPVLGRTFLPDEDRKPGGNPVLVLSEMYWRRHFGADPAAIGATVELNRHPFTIIGVVPAAFRGTMSGLVCDFWAPFSMTREVANFGSLDNRDDRWLHVQARLGHGQTVRSAQAMVDAVGARLEKAYPDTNRQIRLRVLTLLRAPYGVQPIFGVVLSILLALSVGVLLIVAANVSSLLMARAAGRQKEIATRLAVGASRGRLVRQLLTESLILAGLGGALGVLLAYWGVGLLKAWQPPTYLPVGISAKIDVATLGFTVLLTAATGIVFGLAPAWQSTKPDLTVALKEGSRGSGTSVARHRMRNVLVVAEVALALVVLVGAGLCIKSDQRTRHADIGFSPDHVLLAGLRIGMNGYDGATGTNFYERLEKRLAALPGVESVALSSWFPLGFEGGSMHTVTVDGYDRRPGEEDSFPYSIVSPNYFAVMRIPLVEGRDFTDHDDAKAQGVAIINETMARQFWPGQSPIGRKFKDAWRYMTVVGVAKAGKYRFVNEPPRCFYYVPYRQGVWDLNLGVCMRTRQDPVSLSALVQKEVHAVDPRVEVWTTMPMTDYVKAAYAAPVLASRLLSWLGLVALTLAAMGVYGVMAYVVSQRTQEFGVRMALGARARDVLRLVFRQGLTLAGAGVACGLVIALGATRLLASFLYGVSPFDAVTFVGVPVALGAVTLAASWFPARRAARVDPIAALRSE
jgi:predicted permease